MSRESIIPVNLITIQQKSPSKVVAMGSRIHQRADIQRVAQMELKNRIHKWLQEVEGPSEGDDAITNRISADYKFADGGDFQDVILYHPDFLEWALAEDLKRKFQLEREGTVYGVLDQAQSYFLRFVRDVSITW